MEHQAFSQLEQHKLLALRQRLQQDQRVLAAYLLGSAASGRMRPDSDLDLALMTMPGKTLPPLDRIALAAELALEAGIVVDIGHLSSDNLVYAKEAILTGKRIFARDPLQADLTACTLLGMYVRFNEERREVLDAYRT
ncbi:type VII toxin-antitoxin system MntA family adenylyltransferase antitoxin [Desulfonatronum parangueonense]